MMSRFTKAMMAVVVVGIAAGSATAQIKNDGQVLPFPQKPFPFPQPFPFPPKPQPMPIPLPPQPMPQPIPLPPQPAPQWKLGVRISANPTGGLKIHEVFAGSPAELAGLKAGMVLLTVDGVLYNDPAAARDKVMFHSGATLNLVYQDGASFYQVTAQLTTTTLLMAKAPGAAAAEKKVVPMLKNLKRVEVADPRKK
jgi:hypothetical protein